MEGATMPQTAAITTVIVALLALAPTTPATQSRQDVRFTVDANGAVVVPVHLDGHGPFYFMIDTGASASLVADTVVRRLGAPIVARAEVITATGREMREVAQVRVMLGGVSAERLLPSVIPASVLSSVAPRLDGILGQDFLMPHNYTLDYRRRTFRWSILDDMGGTSLPLVERDNRWLLEVSQPDGRVLHLVPDTGSEGLVLFTRQGRAPVRVTEISGGLHLTTLTGGRDIPAVRVRELTLGQIRLKNEPAVIVARDEPDASVVDGLLPLHRFRSVGFQAGTRSLVIER
jgi:predicted aspartyl protease